MVAIRLFAAAMVGAMLAAIIGGFSTSSFTEDGGTIVGLAWGRVTLIDIYLAFVFGWLWIAFRERSAARSGAWLLATLITGSLALGVYLLGASLRATTPTELVLGPHRSAEPSGGTPAGVSGQATGQ